jgi:hypothetical protein
MQIYLSLKSKTNIISPQRHRGHREKPCIVNCTCGAVNKVKLCALCALCGEIFFVLDSGYIEINISNTLKSGLSHYNLFTSRDIFSTL